MENSRYQMFIKTVKKCHIYLEDCLISEEEILRIAQDFLSDSLEKRQHNEAILLHTGSICYEAIVFVMCVLANLIFDENDAIEEASTLEKGTIVSYSKKLWKYEGLYDGNDNILKGKYVLLGEKNEKTYINEASLGNLLPYKGNAKSLRGKGVRTNKTKRIEFLNYVVGLKQNELVATSRLATIVFMDESRLDYLLNNIRLVFEDKQYDLLDLVTVTYYSGVVENKKRGNVSNIEPAIKVTNNIEKARQLIFEKEEKEVFGFVSFKGDVYRKNAMEFEELFHRRKLRYSWLITKFEYNNWFISQLENENKNFKLLSITDDFIRNIDARLVNDNYLSIDYLNELNIVANRQFGYQLIDGIKWSEYKKIKHDILFVLNNCMEDNNAIIFSRWAYSMLKFLNNAFFTMEVFEKSQKLFFQNEISEMFLEQESKIALLPELIRLKCNNIYKYICSLYEDMKNHNAKGVAIKRYIFENKCKKILFVIPSIRYHQLTVDYLDEYQKIYSFFYDICVESNLKNVELSKWDCVIFPALMNFDKVNPIDLINAKRSIVFVYDSQVRLYKKIVREYIEYLNSVNSENTFVKVETTSVSNDYCVENENEIQEIKEENEDEIILQDSFMKLFIQTERYKSKEYFGGKYDNGLEAYKYGQFVSGEHIIFSKSYVAYVINDITGKVEEKKVDDLSIGERLIFTINDDKTKDIVDDILIDICSRREDIKNAYEIVNSWKEKLRELKNYELLTYIDIQSRFQNVGCDLSAQTVRQWMDIESHIVGPKDKDKFIQIGKVLNDSYIIDNYMIYYEATKQIRSIRVQILKLIEKVIIADINGTDIDMTGIQTDTVDKIREVSVIKQIERIENIDSFVIPINRANKPIVN